MIVNLADERRQRAAAQPYAGLTPPDLFLWPLYFWLAVFRIGIGLVLLIVILVLLFR